MTPYICRRMYVLVSKLFLIIFFHAYVVYKHRDLSYNKGLYGPLPSQIGNLKKLKRLNLAGCGFSGSIPPSIGNLEMLVHMALNLNNFTGEIPPSIGNLANLNWLDLSTNNLSGSIPVSDGSTPGLDMLYNTKHFHLQKNQLSGDIPSELFSNLSLLHLLLNDNSLSGSIPSTLGLVQSLLIVRLDGNSLDGTVPANLNNLTSLMYLSLAENKLTGPLPDLTGMESLQHVDMSKNLFDATDIPQWFSSLQNMTSLLMENTNIQGQLPESLFSLFQLQTVVLKNNTVNGTLNIGSNPSTQLQLIDLQNNSIATFPNGGNYSFKIILFDNPICKQGLNGNYCNNPQSSNSSISTSAGKCTNPQSGTSETITVCPYTGNLSFYAPSFSNFDSGSPLIGELLKNLTETFKSSGQPVDSLSHCHIPNEDGYLVLNVSIVLSSKGNFTYTMISEIVFFLSNHNFNASSQFGPYNFIGDRYQCLSESVSSPGSHNTKTIGISVGVGGGFLFLLLLIAGVYAFRQKRRAEIADRRSNPFASWDSNLNSDKVEAPQLQGVKNFSFEELKRCTNNFSEMNDIGSGSYGKVYRGKLPSGQLIAIKRGREGSRQGGLEFKTEIELLSRVHHKNVVSLIGFCFDQGEQMLIYEYVPNGTLNDSLKGRSGIRLDWTRRFRIALGAAKGLQYMHDLANPPIIHRDIKSNNILLDEQLNAKVADFGLSKPMDEPGRGHITTQVKGTMGYMDPEYYMSNQLTEKSDVYSYGVLLFELLTGRNPIENGKYIVRVVKMAMDTNKELYDLQGILEPIVAATTSPKSVEKFVDLAFRCVQESGVDRPRMNEVVKELEKISELAGLNPNSESASTSASYEGSKSIEHPYSNESLFAYSGGRLPSRLVPK